MKTHKEFEEVGFSSKDHIRNRKKNEKRIGGKVLSQRAFANAKSRPSGYNPTFIKKQKEFYKNAKYIRKFNKSVKGERDIDMRHQPLRTIEGGNEDEIETKSRRNKKRKRSSSLRELGEEVEKKRSEAEKARMERAAALQAQKDERAKAEARRKCRRDEMFKRTRSGQPVMKYRIQHLLEGLLQNPNHG